VASGTVSDLVGQCRASGHSGCISAVSGLRGQGVCRSGSVAEVLEVSELAWVHQRDWVGLRSMRYSSQQVQNYTYGELDTDIFLALTCNGISVHKGIRAQCSKTEYACFPLELIILNLPPEV
jgi:hypothetical protein